MDEFEDIYLSMTGELEPGLPWVENAFAEGTECSRAYQELWAARENLCRRFGMDWEDKDLERIMNAVALLEEDFGRRMFRCGIEYARREWER